MPTCELVIFDCDGVLVDSEPISNGVLAELLSSEGLAMTLAQARAEFQGLLLSEVRSRVEQRLGRALPEDWIANYEREREAVFRRELSPVAGAASTLAIVRAAGVAVCVASQGKLSKTRLSLELTGLRELVPPDALFSAEQVRSGKPSPDLFLHAAATMGVDPGACAVVEDTPSGVAAAVSARMRVFGFAADGDEPALRDAGAEIVHRLEEVPERLGLGD